MKKYTVVTQDELDAREDKLLRDGEVLRVPHTLMDHNSLAETVLNRERPLDGSAAISPQARSLPMSDAEQERQRAQIDAKNKRLSDAYKNIPSLPPTADAKPAPTGDVYERRDRALERRWEGAA